ncbi:MAG: hypothetical protein Q9164_007043, partial [Protoblastenia rupestris]
SSEAQDRPDLVQELTFFRDAIMRKANRTFKQTLVDEEANHQEILKKSSARHKDVFASIQDNIDSRVDEIAKKANLLQEEETRDAQSQIHATTSLAKLLQFPGHYGGDARLAKSTTTISKEEFLDLKQELNDTKRTLRKTEDSLLSLKRQALTEGDLNGHDFVTKDQLRNTIRDKNVAIENKVASLIVDMSKSKGRPGQLDDLDSAISEIKEKLANLATGFEERKKSMTQQGAQFDNLEARLEKKSSDFEHVQEELKRCNNDITELHRIVGRNEIEETSLMDRVALAAYQNEILHTSFQSLTQDVRRIQVDGLHRRESTLPPPTDQELDLKIHGIMDQAIEAVRAERSDVDEFILGALDKMEKALDKQQETITDIQNTQSKQSQSLSLRHPPIPPVAQNEVLSDSRMGEYDTRVSFIENYVKSLETTVKGQQQKFDSLTTTRLAHFIIYQMGQVYAYSPDNIVGQLQQLWAFQRGADAAIRNNTSKLNAIDPKAIADLTLGLQAVQKQVQDVVSKADQFRTGVDDMRKNLGEQIQSILMTIGSLKICSDQHSKDSDDIRKTVLSLEKTMEQAITYLKDQTNSTSAEVTSLQEQFKTIVDTNVHLTASSREASNASKTAMICATPGYETEEDRPLREISKLSNASSGTTAVSSKKRSPEVTSISDDDDAIRLTSKRIRRRKNVSKGGLEANL